MKLIIADGCQVMVSDRDFEELNTFRWHIKRRTDSLLYAYRYEKRDGRYVQIKMHRQLMGFPSGKGVDHVNGNTLDNQRSNLRLATQSEQASNMRRRNGKRFKGVSYSPMIHGRWKSNFPFRARIRVGGNLISLGFYATEEEAANAYNDAARKYFGEFSALNGAQA